MFQGASYSIAAGNPERVSIPPLFKELAKEPGQHPILQLPLRQLRNANVIYVPYHRQPVAGGLAYGEDSLAAPSFLLRVKEHPTLRALEAAGATNRIPQVKDAASSLSDLGYHYVMYWYQGEHKPQGWISAYRSFFDLEPVYSDDVVTIWELP